MIDREATKANFLEFLGDKEASRQHVDRRWRGFDDKSFPWIWCLVAFLMSLTVVAIPPALVLLYWAFKPPRTAREHYLAGAGDFVAIETHVVIANMNVSDPSVVGAALAIGSYDAPSPELDEACRRVVLKLQDLWEESALEEPEDSSLFELVANESAEMNRRRLIPAEHSGGHCLYAFDLYIDQSVIDFEREPQVVVIVGPAGDRGGSEPVPVDRVVRI